MNQSQPDGTLLARVKEKVRIMKNHIERKLNRALPERI